MRYNSIFAINWGGIGGKGWGPAKSKICNPTPTRKKFLIPETRPEPEKNWFSNPNPNPTRFRVFFVSGTRCRSLINIAMQRRGGVQIEETKF